MRARKRMMFGKRGLSPIIATVLLISLTLALAIIIFFWAREFVGESVQKDGQAVELLCDETNFVIEVFDGTMWIENQGDIALGGFEVRSENSAAGDIVKSQEIPEGLAPGQATSFSVAANPGDVLFVVPILQGETSTERKSHVCDEQYGREAVVG